MNLQAIADSNLKFILATVGYPVGSIHDARVLGLSGLYDLEKGKQILACRTRDINGVELLLAGNSAHPLNSWLMKSVLRQGTQLENKTINKKFSTYSTMGSQACIWDVANCNEKRK